MFKKSIKVYEMCNTTYQKIISCIDNKYLTRMELYKIILYIFVFASFFAFLMNFVIEHNSNNNPCTHIFVGLAIGSLLLLLNPFLTCITPNKFIKIIVYISLFVMFVVYIESDNNNNLNGQEKDIIFNLIGLFVGFIIYCGLTYKYKNIQE